MNKSITEIHSALVKKKVTPIELVEECISLSEKDKCNCFEACFFDQARKQAK